jgi:hypothetical protein
VIGKIADIYGIWSGIITVACLPIIIFSLAVGLPDPHSDVEEQKKIQPQSRIKPYYAKQKRTTKRWRYSSLDQDVLILRLMAKR